MGKAKVRQSAQECIRLLRDVDFDSLGISQYNLEYIHHMLPELDYFFRIYTDSILILLKKEAKTSSYIVDFGGGHGFLSILLKKIGFKVIYCDHNPLSVQTITLLSEKLGFGPDIILEGTNKELVDYCTVNKITPVYLIATDLIEHVYDLNVFFADLYHVNPGFKMIFTTGSNPLNRFKSRKLRKIMVGVEENYYLPLRREYIEKNYLDLKEKEITTLAKQTRGLTYRDMDDALETFLETGTMPRVKVDRYNTCDPQDGNWMERILPLRSYQAILRKNGFRGDFRKGFYNKNRKNSFSSFLVRIVNKLIKYSGHLGRVFAPFLIIKVSPK